jgi:hypothetical protein
MDEYLSGEQLASCSLRYCAGDCSSWLNLKYSHAPYGSDKLRQVDDLFRLERFPQPFGGYRWYIMCPNTGSRCQCLYKPLGAAHFRSRRAFRVRLQYHSQKQDWHSRLIETSRRASLRMLKAGPSEWREKYKDWEFPPKPPRMRWRTYDREYAKWEASEQMSDVLLAQWVLKLGGT